MARPFAPTPSGNSSIPSSVSRSVRSRSSVRCANSRPRTRPRSAMRSKRGSVASRALWPKGRPCRPMADTSAPSSRPTTTPSDVVSLRGGEGRSGAAPLEDVMLAMDVVDTLRHREDWVARELEEGDREAALIERLRQIYEGQGIAVSDRVLREGVRALEESRFVYTPPKPGLATMLARLWVARDLVGQGLLAILAVLALAWVAHYVVVVRPLENTARTLAEAHAGV